MIFYNSFECLMKEMIRWGVSLISCQHLKFQYFRNGSLPLKHNYATAVCNA